MNTTPPKIRLRGVCKAFGPKVVLDGLVIERLDDYPALIDRLIDPESVAGVEIFPSSAGVPAQYAGIDVTCGVILFWTRR